VRRSSKCWECRDQNDHENSKNGGSSEQVGGTVYTNRTSDAEFLVHCRDCDGPHCTCCVASTVEATVVMHLGKDVAYAKRQRQGGEKHDLEDHVDEVFVANKRAREEIDRTTDGNPLSVVFSVLIRVFVIEDKKEGKDVQAKNKSED
jgi:hypothetical protein